MIFLNRTHRRGGRLVAYLIYVLIIGAGVAVLFKVVPSDVIDAVKETYFQSSTDINP